MSIHNQLLPPPVELTTIEAVWQTAGDRAPHWVFRGQACRRWPLTSTLGRIAGTTTDAQDLAQREREAFEIFRRFALDLPDIEPVQQELLRIEDNTAGLVMRHYGAPTRALDWSHSFWVAAYFASVEWARCDAAIWAIDAQTYAVAAKEHPDHRFFERGGDFEGSRLFLPDAPPHIIFVHLNPAFHFPRIRAQQGLFSVATAIGVEHADAFSKYMPRGSIQRWTIPATLKAEVVNACLDQGVSHRTLYPDLHGAARATDRLFDDLRDPRCECCGSSQ